uniref:Uncharacterized protein n=1 Tax=Glossina palpalis gambiensis TaxID=67801 RepID=A0A1B0BRW4_9MUSC
MFGKLLTLCVSNAFPTTANAAHQYSKHKDGKTGELPPTTSPLKSNGRPIHYYMQIFRQVLKLLEQLFNPVYLIFEFDMKILLRNNFEWKSKRKSLIEEKFYEQLKHTKEKLMLSWERRINLTAFVVQILDNDSSFANKALQYPNFICRILEFRV